MEVIDKIKSSLKDVSVLVEELQSELDECKEYGTSLESKITELEEELEDLKNEIE